MSRDISASPFNANELFRSNYDCQMEGLNLIEANNLFESEKSTCATLSPEPGLHPSYLDASCRGSGTGNCSSGIYCEHGVISGEKTLSGPPTSNASSSIPSNISTKFGCSSVAGKPPNKKKYQRLSQNAVEVLRSWVSRHQEHPYPTAQEMKTIAQESGLNTIQVSNWFANMRRRKGPRAEIATEVRQPVDSLTPMERWQNSPPEYEGATTSDIMRALVETPFSDKVNSTQYTSDEGWSSHSSNTSFALGTPYVGSFVHSQSSGSDILPGGPHQTFRPPTPIPGKSSRRRRRKLERETLPWNERKTQSKRIYQCTFCSDSFLTKYDWQRHEKALHLSVDRWTCARQGGIRDIDGVRICEFCEASGVDSDHLETHNYLSCQKRGPEDRKFIRKDHLQQHLKLVHHVSYRSSMDRWRDSELPLISRCGFCEAVLENWQKRVDHISDHFKKGADMIHWKGDWGFEPEVQSLVKNAMPPFLLGQERHTMDPWKMSDPVGTQGDEDPALHMNVPNGLDRYMDLRRNLVAYMRSEIAGGLYPSDKQIQDKARQMAYGSDDPWDQTYADDPVWLKALKREASDIYNPDFNCFDEMFEG